MHSEIEKLNDLLIGTWEYLPDKFITFPAYQTKDEAFERLFFIKETFFDLIIIIPSIGISSGKILSYNYSSITIINTTTSVTYHLSRIK
ncbi:hypothetical protein GCM10023149_21520 [Mucilaginibacter gynuensis]|uniref:Uncharacterized protein n=1 Tax=Mucilaginibacter gynuensis TaxID=1302236 RepID=A0ABP8GC20_9SPHI